MCILKGLKISRGQLRAGSTPAVRTTQFILFALETDPSASREMLAQARAGIRPCQQPIGQTRRPLVSGAFDRPQQPIQAARQSILPVRQRDAMDAGELAAIQP
jgi:hypothetical protein